MPIDSTLQAFLIPEVEKERFASLREGILIRKSSIPWKSLQRLMGKCISFSLAFPGAKFYIREMAQAVEGASPKGEIQLTAGLREELEFWRFLDEWDKHIRGKIRNTGFCQSRRMLHCHAGLASFIVNLMTWYLGTSGNSISQKSA